MTGFEIVVGALIAFGLVAAAIALAFLSTVRWGPKRHDIRGGGDYASDQPSQGRSRDNDINGGSGGD